jgi:phosphoribosyl 1,2-cyclic phosphodiesterase
MLSLCGIDTFAFRTSHDAAESFGFRFNRSNDAIGFMTDTGIATGESLEALTDCRVLALEANHDMEMLANGPYPSFLKARITGSRGHLSNVQGAELLESLLDNRLESVVAMHVSQVNDTYGLAGSALASALERNCHPACSFVSYQDAPVSIG